MHAAVITHLRCPVCAESLQRQVDSLRCPRGHSFDIARQGYADLTAGRVTHSGDSAEMVTAREELLGAGHFDVVADAVADAVGGVPPSALIIEVGAGTARYLQRTLGAAGSGRVGLAVDVSKPALRRAARLDPRIGAVRADVWQGLPVHDGAATAIVDVFAPRSGPEFARALKQDGHLVVVTPTNQHLSELRDLVRLIGVDAGKQERLARSLDRWFELRRTQRITSALTLTRRHAEALIAMGPSARHLHAAQITEALAAAPEPVEATLDVELTVWAKRSR